MTKQIGPGMYQSTLANDQEQHARQLGASQVCYRLYTETRPNLASIVGRYFTGATLLSAVGLWEGTSEQSTVVEVIASLGALQDIVHLAGDIKQANAQSCVLVTWHRVSRLDV